MKLLDYLFKYLEEINYINNNNRFKEYISV